MTDELSDKQLKFGYWFVTNKLFLEKVLIVIFIVFNIFLITYNIFLLVTNLGVEAQKYAKLQVDVYQPIESLKVVRDAQLPNEVQVSGLETYSRGQNFDLVANVVNPNVKWFADFNYQFITGSGATELKQGFIFPGESKRLIDLNVEGGNTVANVVISDVVWTRKNDYDKFYRERFVFDIQNIKIIEPQELDIGDKLPVSRVSFEVKNVSAYNYRDVIFQIYLYSGANIVAVDTALAETLYSSESRILEATWYSRLPKISNVDVVPEINIFNYKSYIEY